MKGKKITKIARSGKNKLHLEFCSCPEVPVQPMEVLRKVLQERLQLLIWAMREEVVKAGRRWDWVTSLNYKNSSKGAAY